jgi:hypothetical protein
MSTTRIVIYVGEAAVAVGAGVKDSSIGSFLMVGGLCAIFEGIIALGIKAGLFK